LLIGTMLWVAIHLLSMQSNMDGKQMTQTNTLFHGTWQMEYHMLLNTSSIWSGVAVFQSDHVDVGTVAAWDANLFAHCSAPVVVVPPAQIPST
jgi:hypothetical protein